jgi:hypothetical protein
MGLIDRVQSKIRRDASIGIERTLVYSITPADYRPPLLDTGPFRLMQLGSRELPRLGDIGPVDLGECDERLSRGDLCYGVWIGDALAHYSWVQGAGSHEISAAGLEQPVAPADFWIYNCRTADRFRGRRIYPYVLEHIVDRALAAGKRCGWIYTSGTNYASQRGISRAGFVLRHTLRAFRLGRRFLSLA